MTAASSSDAADMMLALLRGGAPNADVLAASTIDDLLLIAKQHDIRMPSPRSPELKSKVGDSEREASSEATGADDAPSSPLG